MRTDLGLRPLCDHVAGTAFAACSLPPCGSVGRPRLKEGPGGLALPMPHPPGPWHGVDTEGPSSDQARELGSQHSGDHGSACAAREPWTSLGAHLPALASPPPLGYPQHRATGILQDAAPQDLGPSAWPAL